MKLQQFQALEGHCLVSQSYKSDDGYKLGAWVGRQRFRKDRVSSDNIKRLDALGFIWDPAAHVWRGGLKKLQDFVNIQGDCKVPFGHKTEDGFLLGRWVIRQRKIKDSLSADQLEKLNALDFIWDKRARN